MARPRARPRPGRRPRHHERRGDRVVDGDRGGGIGTGVRHHDRVGERLSGSTGSAESVFTIERSADAPSPCRCRSPCCSRRSGRHGRRGDRRGVRNDGRDVREWNGHGEVVGTDAPTTSAADVVHVSVDPAIEQSASDSVPIVPAGIASVTTTSAGTSNGPLFVIVMVRVVHDPGLTVVTPSVLLIDRSAEAVTVSTSVAASFDPSGLDERRRRDRTPCSSAPAGRSRA